MPKRKSTATSSSNGSESKKYRLSEQTHNESTKYNYSSHIKQFADWLMERPISDRKLCTNDDTPKNCIDVSLVVGKEAVFAKLLETYIENHMCKTAGLLHKQLVLKEAPAEGDEVLNMNDKHRVSEIADEVCAVGTLSGFTCAVKELFTKQEDFYKSKVPAEISGKLDTLNRCYSRVHHSLCVKRIITKRVGKRHIKVEGYALLCKLFMLSNNNSREIESKTYGPKQNHLLGITKAKCRNNDKFLLHRDWNTGKESGIIECCPRSTSTRREECDGCPKC